MDKIDQTKEQYLKRAVYLIKKAHKEAKDQNHKALKAISAYKDTNSKQFLGLSLYNTAIWFKQFWAINLRAKTIRQYRASLIYFCEVELLEGRLEKEVLEKIKNILY